MYYLLLRSMFKFLKQLYNRICPMIFTLSFIKKAILDRGNLPPSRLSSMGSGIVVTFMPLYQFSLTLAQKGSLLTRMSRAVKPRTTFTLLTHNSQLLFDWMVVNCTWKREIFVTFFTLFLLLLFFLERPFLHAF